MNFELIKEMKGEDIVTYTKSQRIKWLGHVMRASKERAITIITGWTPTVNRRRGRPNLRWLVDVEEDLKKLGIKKWKDKCKNRKEWANIAQEARTSSKLNE
ncbi:hypothetical protein RI129_008627 [Pyrocoelia pectoralis]|uniref:Uncharacterized protein n=1 Tax=Pyrocoelia pectoralis TaxID=417401 RepID=A0AAN7V5S6_9COLE